MGDKFIDNYLSNELRLYIMRWFSKNINMVFNIKEYFKQEDMSDGVDHAWCLQALFMVEGIV